MRTVSLHYYKSLNILHSDVALEQNHRAKLEKATKMKEFTQNVLSPRWVWITSNKMKLLNLT